MVIGIRYSRVDKQMGELRIIRLTEACFYDILPADAMVQKLDVV